MLKLKKLPIRNFLKIESSVLKNTSRPIFLNHNKIKPNQITIKYVRQKTGGNEEEEKETKKKNNIPNGGGNGNNGKENKLNS
jgi:hypothetical protein